MGDGDVLEALNHGGKLEALTPSSSICFSVVVPARNAAKTLAHTLNSLLAQGHVSWECIIIDNGSTDKTLEIAKAYGGKDPRFKILSEPSPGVSQARNRGIANAKYNWLLFLDADDWILPTFFEQAAETLQRDPCLDAVICGCSRVNPVGEIIMSHSWPIRSDMFPSFARSTIAIHSCVVRLKIVQEAGGFNPELRTCEDWDLWQRIARAGARFGEFPGNLAIYYTRPDSACTNLEQLLNDGLRVIRQGHAADPRVSIPVSAYANGLSTSNVVEATLCHLCWLAGLMIGQCRDPVPLLNCVEDRTCPELNPTTVANLLFGATRIPSSSIPHKWSALWKQHNVAIIDFLEALEKESQSTQLCRRTQVILERLIIRHTQQLPWTAQFTHGTFVDITQPIQQIVVSSEIERMLIEVRLGSERLGTLELPTTNGTICSLVLSDAIANAFGWNILREFFAKNLYPQLTFKQDAEGVSIWRGELCLAEKLPNTSGPQCKDLHNQIGWTVFLQEFWNRPQWNANDFYDRNKQDVMENGVVETIGEWLTIELTSPLPGIASAQSLVQTELTIAGTSVARIQLIPGTSPQELRVAATELLGTELLKIAVREALLGQSWADGSLWKLLENKIPGSSSTTAPETQPTMLAPNSGKLVAEIIEGNATSILLGMRRYGPISTALSRRYAFPAEVQQEIVEEATQNEEPVLNTSAKGGGPCSVLYCPELIWNHASTPIDKPLFDRSDLKLDETSAYNRHHFEAVFANSHDPWRYTTPYEATKYQQTLSLLPDGRRIRRALEIGCAEGHFTGQLASRVDQLIAADISEIALRRAAVRCAAHRNLSFTRLDLTKDKLPANCDLIVCSELLYYLGNLETLKAAAQKIADALAPGGLFLTTHAFVLADNPTITGFDWDVPFGAKTIAEVFSNIFCLRLAKQLNTDLYQIQLFQKNHAGLRRVVEKISPRKLPCLEAVTYSAPPPEIEKHIRWKGGALSRRPTTRITTTQLPILMYHRVSADGHEATRRYRLSPEQFEAQLRYLRECGFRSATMSEWRDARRRRRAMEGRCVHLTFDDGCSDFKTNAWPLLRKYGFSATLFAVAGQVGKFNSWDAAFGEQVPLLNWDELRELLSEGAEIGSHTMTHTPLTALNPAAIIREASNSRRILENNLKVPVLTFAYPHGDTDPVVEHSIGACGYEWGFTCRPAFASFNDPQLALPRIEISGSDTLEEFVAKVSGVRQEGGLLSAKFRS